MLQKPQKTDPCFELVKNEGRYNEKVLCTSTDKYMLGRKKLRLIKTRGRNTYRVRPQLVRVKPLDNFKQYDHKTIRHHQKLIHGKKKRQVQINQRKP